MKAHCFRAGIPKEVEVVCLEALLESWENFLNSLALEAAGQHIAPLFSSNREWSTIGNSEPSSARGCKASPCLQAICHLHSTHLTTQPPSSQSCSKRPSGDQSSRESVGQPFVPPHTAQTPCVVIKHWPRSFPKAEPEKHSRKATQCTCSHLTPHTIHLLQRKVCQAAEPQETFLTLLENSIEAAWD